MVLPNFLIIGAAKAGTTSLYASLNQHPQIFMCPEKEPRFFALEGEPLQFGGPTQANINSASITDLDSYRQLFAGVTNESAIGEASTLYLSNPKAPERIQHYLPDAKLIAVLRDPADRAFSSYMHLVRDGYETLSFAEGLKAEPSRIAAHWQPLWYYQQRGFYHEQLQRYFARFSPEQIKIYLFEDLTSDGVKVMQDIATFLEVDPTFTPELSRENASGVPKRRWLQNLLTKDNPIKSAVKPLLPKSLRQSIGQGVKKRNLGEKLVLAPEIRQQLIALYRDDILKLQDLIQRDLSRWLT